ncbi:hypothetical protein FPOA_09313 [Fusarium poae]|uniref:F-box domain-containing protein n=1 Tax=Fusarium poae TaxID=36050 RepID=A0A1B8ARL5_FUSPO|nr:hypothetical protein FPOA_09313 [Fusarium poae]
MVDGTRVARSRIFEIVDQEEDALIADMDNLDALRRYIAASTILNLAQNTLIKLCGHDPSWVHLSVNHLSDKDSTRLELESDTGGQEPQLEPSQGRIIRLPVDILWLILGFVNQSPTNLKRKTLLSLSSSSKQLKALADSFIYSHPSITCVSTQWLFLLSLRLRPSLGNHVKCLTLFCDQDELSLNLMLLTEIASCCRNLKDLRIHDRCMEFCLVCIEYPPEGRVTSTDWHLIYMGSLFARCPQIENFRYKTGRDFRYEDTYHYTVDIVEDIPEIPFAHCHFAEGFQIAGSNLKRLDIDEDSTWLVNALLPHLSSNLTALAIERNNAVYGDHPLSTLSIQCPHLQELVLGYSFSDPIDVSDFVQACTNWRSTLHTLKVKDFGSPGWLPQIMPLMTALRTLSCGSHFPCLGEVFTSFDIASIAESKAPLELIILKNIGLPIDAIASQEIDDALVDMIVAHSSRLKILSLTGLKFGQSLLTACKKAKHLRYLYFEHGHTRSLTEVDDLLVTCPKLDFIALCLSSHGQKEEVWRRRRERSRWSTTGQCLLNSATHGLHDNGSLID